MGTSVFGADDEVGRDLARVDWSATPLARLPWFTCVSLIGGLELFPHPPGQALVEAQLPAPLLLLLQLLVLPRECSGLEQNYKALPEP